MADLKPAFDAKSVQADLILLGYLPKGGDDGKWGFGSKRALKRLQRRATNQYRISSLTGQAADCGPGDFFQGIANGEINQATLEEIKKWKDKKWKTPLARFQFKDIHSGKLREDAADEWMKLVTKIKGLGGTIDGPYGDTKRALGKATKAGASSFSFHIVGRAVDLNQSLAGPPNQRYYIAKEILSTGTFWRIYCKTDKQDGTQGKKYEKDTISCWSFYSKKEYKLPAGQYLDLTAEIESGGKFERIKAQSGWESAYNRSEYWHFQYKVDIQKTFQDECELVGISTKDLNAAGYSDALLEDQKPG